MNWGLVRQESFYEHIREGECTVYFSLASSAISSYVFFSSGAISLHISPNFRPTSVNERPGFSSLIRFLTELLNTTNDVAGFLGPPCKSPGQRQMLGQVLRGIFDICRPKDHNRVVSTGVRGPLGGVGYGYVPPKGPPTIVETTLLFRASCSYLVSQVFCSCFEDRLISSGAE